MAKSDNITIHIDRWLLRAILLSVVTHLLFILFSLPSISLHKNPVAEKKRPLTIESIRFAGDENSKIKNIYLPDMNRFSMNEKNENEKSKKSTKATAAPSLALSDLNVETTSQDKHNRSAIEAIKLSGPGIKRFLKGESAAAPAAAAPSFQPQDAMDKSSVSVQIEVPKGVNPDELNKFEMVFYSFQKRTAMNYISSFQRNFNDFNRQNPHLNFPLTKNQQIMTGRVTYDEEGNVKLIKMVKWTKVEKLQDFFLDVLKEMNSLQNPPKELVRNGEFSIYYSLIVN
jgi:hypothetical protein